MAKIDRLGWTAGISFTSFGVRVGIRVSGSNCLDAVADCLPPGSTRVRLPYVDRLYSLVSSGPAQSARVRRFHVLYVDTLRIARTMDAEGVMTALESDLRLYIAEHARRRVFVHAGVVGWNGGAIVIPGSSLSGKSTLVAALVRAG